MNVAIILTPYESIKLRSPKKYDLVLSPNDSLPGKMTAKAKAKITPITSQHRLEWELLEPQVSCVANSLSHSLGPNLQLLLKRGLYLSAAKTELRLLIDSDKKLRELDLGPANNLDIFYSYFNYPGIFEGLPFCTNWFLCQRYSGGKFSKLVTLFGYLKLFQKKGSV